ncbi:MAG: hypothetical protein CEN92_12 [Candidatus Berkelbacteria bacterium Licking1014_96]|uniref:Uncharacterized protein n=1 Tax=Candidatus Berkelbacteria bacterium Licking1014_96 TaxID=2017149 RepID=A0A554LHI6_9BACT|nr:MAG: hypothetical protein CEN92_12 [Candidatus Berkelbacteria bacterium Licking1014_96]
MKTSDVVTRRRFHRKSHGLKDSQSAFGPASRTDVSDVVGIAHPLAAIVVPDSALWMIKKQYVIPDPCSQWFDDFIVFIVFDEKVEFDAVNAINAVGLSPNHALHFSHLSSPQLDQAGEDCLCSDFAAVFVSQDSPLPFIE